MKAIPRAVLVLSGFFLGGSLRAEPIYGGWPLSAWIGRLKSPVKATRYEAMVVIGQFGPKGASTIPTLIEIFHTGDEEEQDRAAYALAHIGADGIEQVTRFLSAPKPTQRVVAARALAQIGTPAKESAPALVKALTDPAFGVRIAAAEALWEVAKDPAGVAAICESLSSTDLQRKCYSLIYLSQIGEAARAAVPALVKNLTDDHLGLRLWSAKLLIQLGHARAAVPALRELLRYKAATTEEPGIAMNTRVRAAELLLELRADSGSVLPVLVEALRNPWIERKWSEDYDTYSHVLSAFQRLGAKGVPELVRALDDDNIAVKAAAAEALFHAGALPIPAVTRLRRLAEPGQNDLLRGLAVRALVRAGEPLDETDIKILCEQACDPRYGTPTASEFEKFVLGDAKLKETLVPVLAKALQNEDKAFRANAAELLAGMGPSVRPVVPALRRLIKEELERLPNETEWPARTWAAIALVNLGEATPEIVPLLFQANVAILVNQIGGTRKQQDQWRREQAAKALVGLAKSRESAVLAALLESLGAEGSWDSVAAADILQQIHNAKTANVVKPLAHALLTGTVHLRTKAVKILAEIGREARGASPELLLALDDPEPMVRVQAACALWQIDGKAAVVLPVLREGIKDPKVEVRLVAMQELGELGEAAAACIPEIAAFWADENMNSDRVDPIFFAIAPDAVPALLTQLERREPQIRDNAARLLGNFGPAAVEPLIRTVRRKDGDTQRAAVEALRMQGPAALTALPVLRPLLKHDDMNLRFSAALAVRSIDKQTKDALPIVLHALRHLEPVDRLRAVQELREMGTAAEGAAPVLAKALTDDDDRVRYCVVQALTAVPDGKRTLPALIRMLHEDEDQGVRARVAQSLGIIPMDAADAKTVIIHLAAALKDRNGGVNNFAMGALESLSDKGLPSAQALIDVLDDSNIGGNAWNLLKKHGAAAVPHLRTAMAHPRAAVRIRATYLLGEFGNAALAAQPDLLRALHSKDENLRAAAASTIRQLGPRARQAAQHEQEALHGTGAGAATVIE